MQWMLMPYRRYFDFSGRSGRREYWMYVLFNLIVFGIGIAVVIGPIIAAIDTTGSTRATDLLYGSVFFALPPWARVVLVVMEVFGLIGSIPHLAVTVRRLHDQNRTGWWYVLAFIPRIGGLIMLGFMCIGGSRGANRFGSDPTPPDAEAFA